MLKETEETIDFVVIIFIIGGISCGEAPPFLASPMAEQVDATQTHHKR